MAFCDWASQVTGRNVHLPSEAQWEKAARGTDGRIYPWGDQGPDRTYCNFNRNVEDTTPVYKYSPKGDSPYGCVDMAGNVWEWTSSLHREYPYNPADGREDLKDRGTRVARGGAHYYLPEWSRCANRWGFNPEHAEGNLGFRVVVSPI